DAAASTLSVATSASDIAWRRCDDAKMAPSASSSPATPTITINSNAFGHRFNFNFQESLDSPIRPTTRTQPNNNNKSTDQLKTADAADCDNRKLPISFYDLAGAAIIVIQGLGLMLLLFRRLR